MDNFIKEFIYDGSFEGLLSCIYYAYPIKESLTITKEENYVPNMLNQISHINTEKDKYERVYKSIKNKLNDTILSNIYIVYLSEFKDGEDIILKYLKLCYKYGTSINLAKNNDIIIKIDSYVKKVYIEAERFRQFVRFKEIAPLSFYAKIEPDHNILSLLIDHFTERFSDQKFIIHDIKRETALIYNKESSIIINMSKEESDKILSLNSNNTFENLFKIYYKSATIKERINIKCRDNFMPRRYQKNLTELW